MPRANDGWTGGAEGTTQADLYNIPSEGALSRRDDRGLGGTTSKFSFDLAEKLIKAIKEYPSAKLACAACGISYETVKGWLRKAGQPGAPPAMIDFAKLFLRADADAAKEAMHKADTLLEEGKPGANSIYNYVDRRWKVCETPVLIDLVEGAQKGTDNLEQLLANPTPRLLHLLRKTGWIRHEAWGTPNWGQVITTTGVPANVEAVTKDP